MRKFVLVLCVLVVLGTLRGISCTTLTWEEFVDMVRRRPMPEKYEFIRDNYLRGYELARKKPEDIQVLDRESELALEMFQLVIRKETRNSKEDVERLLTMSTICFPLPIGCIDPGDSGLRPMQIMF
ncbi:uncharacterized protein LOC109543328 [Dendroctonus ponderosae]|uniref:uncharacterized protein LOC109543328 n=1 Tax=Dendroctonus ponderosae TaxID=77166 RepID=UPI0020366294|nr:uncharacterized protein LOC109543328 [Dendroctonus ponderosae]KAH1008709.1 hypothetical protein HUJ05_009242 [Dendroctonus ponderosae]